MTKLELKEVIVSTIRKENSKERHLKIIELMDEFESKHFLDPMEQCWVYWNKQDAYALLRDYDSELEVFNTFTEYVKELDEIYWWWPINDGTQRNTMYLGGYNEVWKEWYYHVSENVELSEDSVTIAFETHRANVALFHLPKEYEHIESLIPDVEISKYALNKMKEIIKIYPTHKNILFFRITYLTMKFRLLCYLEEDLKQVIEESLSVVNLLFDVIGEEKKWKYYPLGSWEQLNSVRSLEDQACIGIRNFNCALAINGFADEANALYERIKPYGTTAYLDNLMSLL